MKQPAADSIADVLAERRSQLAAERKRVEDMRAGVEKWSADVARKERELVELEQALRATRSLG